MKRILIFSLPVILVILYLLGPRPEKPVYETSLPSVPSVPGELEMFIAGKEKQHQLKPGNEARIIWADSSKTKTPYSIVYLHGFSASHREGGPIHTDLADRYGANLYLSRLSDHGIDTVDALYYFTPDRFWQSGKEALAIGKQLGEKVILLSTSTGGTLALMLAAAYPDDVHALINMSPNVRINNPLAFIANDPWGLQIARLIRGGKLNEIDYPEERRPYWNVSYRYEAVVQMQELLETSMREDTFKNVKQPVLNLYYYKDDKNQDPAVSIKAMRWMHQLLGTGEAYKREVAIPGVGEHVIGCDLTSKDLAHVSKEINKFMREVLKMHPVKE